MAYIINKYNGDQAAVVEDGTINTTLDLKLIGKNYAGYGEAQNENYTWLLENFSSLTAPPKAIIGQLWYDTSTSKLKINYGAGLWRTMGVTQISTSGVSPSGLTEGDFWWNTVTEQLFCKGASSNVLIGGSTAGVITQMKSTTVTSNDVVSVTYNVIEAIINGVTAFVISGAAAAFTLNSLDPLKALGFSDIHPGITLKGLSTSNLTSPTYKIWGSVSNSDNLGGIDSSNYVNKATAVFSNIANFADDGLSIGTAPNQRLYIRNEGTTPTIYNSDNSTIQFKTTVSSSIKIPMKLVGQDIIPGNPGQSNIGSADLVFGSVYANSFVGLATQAASLTINGVAKTASVEATIDTVVVRTASNQTIGSHTLPAGSIKVVTLMATNTTTYFGDVAEKYVTDNDYETGTVLMIGGTAEVTAATAGFRALGVVSANPAYLMNADLENGIAVALKGRVPVKVIGTVKKGDRLIASATDGYAESLSKAADAGFVFAIALANKSKDSDTVEATII
jgi:hypothetical protein